MQPPENSQADERGGFLYLTIILDIFHRFSVGWSVSNSLRAEETSLYTVDKQNVVQCISVTITDPRPAVLPATEPLPISDIEINFPAMVEIDSKITITILSLVKELYLKVNEETWYLGAGTEKTLNVPYTATQTGTHTVQGVNQSGVMIWTGSFEVYRVWTQSTVSDSKEIPE